MLKMAACASSYINRLASRKSRSQKLKVKKSSNLIVLNTTITTGETRRHVSLEAYDPYGALVKDDTDPLQEVINKEEMDQLHHSINQLKPEQQKLVMKKFWNDMKQVDIAKDDGVTKMAITKRFQTIYRRLKKNLQK